MPIIDLIRLNEGHRWQCIILHILLELRGVLDVIPERRGHDRSCILDRITNATEVRSDVAIKKRLRRREKGRCDGFIEACQDLRQHIQDTL